MVRATLNHKAFTLIELLFAIMIMGITMVAVPVIMSSNNKGFDSIIIQEAIFAASAELNQVLSYRWDEASINEVDDPSALGLAGVVNVADCNNTSSSSRFRLRPGHIAQPLHRRCVNSTTNPSGAIGLNGIETVLTADDIDDINLTAKSMFLNDATTDVGYKHDYQSEFSITPTAIQDSTNTYIVPAAHSKYIEIIVKDTSGNIVTKLRSYAINVGEVDFYKRTY